MGEGRPAGDWKQQDMVVEGDCRAVPESPCSTSYVLG